jgi:hypothetical protein
VNILIILAVNLILFWRSIFYSYVSDDIPTFHNRPPFKNKFHKWFLWSIGSWKCKSRYEHILTLFLHSLVGVFIYLGFGANQVSFWAALLFSCNPANNQGSIWISGRGYVLPPLMLLISLTSPFLAPICLWAMPYFNLGFVMPLTLVGSKSAYFLAIMPFIWWFWLKKFKKDVSYKANFEQVDEDRKFHLGKIILAIKTVGFYFMLGLIPFRITFYHSFLQAVAGSGKKKGYTLKDKFLWIGVGIGAFWVLYTAYNWYFFRKWDTISYGLWWFFIMIAPFSNLKRLHQEISERYIYTPLIGLMLALATAIVNYPIVCAVILAIYITKFSCVMHMYQDDYWILEHAVIEDPKAWFAWHMRALKRWEAQSYREALVNWVMAKLISPTEFKLLFNISCVLRLLKKDKEAQEYFALAKQHTIPGQEKELAPILKDWEEGKLRLLT